MYNFKILATVSVSGGFVPKDPISDAFYDNEVSVPSITSEASDGKVENNKYILSYNFGYIQRSVA